MTREHRIKARRLLARGRAYEVGENLTLGALLANLTSTLQAALDELDALDPLPAPPQDPSP